MKDDPYEAPFFAYNKEMDQLVEANTTICEVEEEQFGTCANGGLIKSNEDKNTMQKT